MGQHTPSILPFVRSFKFKRHHALARRRKMARPRLELLAGHVAGLPLENLLDSRVRFSTSSICHSERSFAERNGVEESPIGSMGWPAITTSGFISSRIGTIACSTPV